MNMSDMIPIVLVVTSFAVVASLKVWGIYCGRNKRQPTDLDKLLIKPEGVESPVHEICVAILKNLDNKRFRFSRGEAKIVYSPVGVYHNTPTLTYDTIKNASISFTDKHYLGPDYHYIKDLSINGVVLTLSKEEEKYLDKVWIYVEQHLQSKKGKLARLKEQRHRRAITKLYSEVIPNDQTN